ncbi:unnamed protein product [Scytosiphon promiscuus]
MSMSVEAILAALFKESETNEVKMAVKAARGRFVLEEEFYSEDVSMVKAVLEAFREILDNDEVKTILVPTSIDRMTILALAVRHGRDISMCVLEALSTVLDHDEIKAMLREKHRKGLNMILWYAVSNIRGLSWALKTLRDQLGTEEVEVILTEEHLDRTIARLAAEEWGDEIRTAMEEEDKVGAVLYALGVLEVADGVNQVIDRLDIETAYQYAMESLRDLSSKDDVNPDEFREILENALDDGGEITFEAVLTDVGDVLTGPKVREMATPETDNDKGLVPWAIQLENSSALSSILKHLRRYIDKEQVANEATKGFTVFCAKVISDGRKAVKRDRATSSFWDLPDADDTSFETLQWAPDRVEWAQAIFVCLLQNHARPECGALVELSRMTQHVWMKDCCMKAVASADNPFSPGFCLSVALAEAVKRAREGERHKLNLLQESVDQLLLEILERLPQTVLGFEDSMAGCSAVFEPELESKRVGVYAAKYGSTEGPLSVALKGRSQTETFCSTPLVTDFLSRMFTRGLPNWRDSDDILRDPIELEYLAGFTQGRPKWPVVDEFLLSSQHLKGLVTRKPREDSVLISERDIPTKQAADFLRRYLQGAEPIAENDGHRMTVLPGVQFIAAGLLVKPSTYFEIPAMRMMLDFVVYLAMLVFFSVLVLFHEETALTRGEMAFSIHVVAGVCAELGELTKDVDAYLRNRWNLLDILGLALSLSGFFVRRIDDEEPWGRGLYALSAPFLFSRILFFGQILQFQGPMIQVIAAMMADFIRFAVIMAVVMLGFAVSFFALFRDGTTWLNVFNAMLGDVFFEDFEGEVYEAVGTILLVMYLIVITILLLNLLIAVLSTSHSRMQDKAEQEYKVSKARFVQHYSSVVSKDLLPPPFNLLNMSFVEASCNTESSRRAKLATLAQKSIGRFVFWAVLGPLAVAGGSFVWLLSALFSPLWRRSKLGYCLTILWCIFGAPICLLTLWLGLPVLGLVRYARCRRGAEFTSRDLHESRRQVSVNTMLKNAPGGLVARDLARFLDNPMSDSEVRQDETTRPTTVEHIKLLRDRLEETTQVKVASLGKEVAARLDDFLAVLNTRIERATRKSARRDNQADPRWRTSTFCGGDSKRRSRAR